MGVGSMAIKGGRVLLGSALSLPGEGLEGIASFVGSMPVIGHGAGVFQAPGTTLHVLGDVIKGKSGTEVAEVAARGAMDGAVYTVGGGAALSAANLASAVVSKDHKTLTAKTAERAVAAVESLVNKGHHVLANMSSKDAVAAADSYVVKPNDTPPVAKAADAKANKPGPAA